LRPLNPPNNAPQATASIAAMTPPSGSPALPPAKVRVGKGRTFMGVLQSPHGLEISPDYDDGKPFAIESKFDLTELDLPTEEVANSIPYAESMPKASTRRCLEAAMARISIAQLRILDQELGSDLSTDESALRRLADGARRRERFDSRRSRAQVRFTLAVAFATLLLCLLTSGVLDALLLGRSIREIALFSPLPMFVAGFMLYQARDSRGGVFALVVVSIIIITATPIIIALVPERAKPSVFGFAAVSASFLVMIGGHRLSD
jgi:hypothetical protein